MIIIITLLLTITGCLAERSYTLEVEKLAFDDKAADFVSEANVILTAFNKTATVITGLFKLVKEIPKTANVLLLGFEQNSGGNDYQREATFRRSGDLCKFIENDDTVMPELRLYSNVPEKCPIDLKTYELVDFLLEGKSLPDKIPGAEHWRFELQLFKDNNTNGDSLGKVQAFIFFKPK